MSGSPFLSVVMPVYNTEKYLHRAIDSVIQQTFSNFELILVNDCSVDDSGKICDEYVECDKRVSVIHLKINGGVSNARNCGISTAKGQYITFIDADDYIDHEIYQTAYEQIQIMPIPQAIIWGVTEEYLNKNDLVYLNKTMVLPDKRYNNYFDVREAIIELERQTLFGYTVNKFYSLDIINQKNILFDIRVKINEDFLFNLEYFKTIECMQMLSTAPYHYMKRSSGSATAQFIPDYFDLHQKRVQMIYNQYQLWNMLTDEIKEAIVNIYTRFVFSAIERNCNPIAKMTHKDKKFWIAQLFHSDFFNELITNARTNTSILGVMGLLLKRKQVWLCLCIGYVIYLLKNKFPMAFSRLKQKR